MIFLKIINTIILKNPIINNKKIATFVRLGNDKIKVLSNNFVSKK